MEIFVEFLTLIKYIFSTHFQLICKLSNIKVRVHAARNIGLFQCSPVGKPLNRSQQTITVA
jgi:hypothetical protein